MYLYPLLFFPVAIYAVKFVSVTGSMSTIRLRHCVQSDDDAAIGKQRNMEYRIQNSEVPLLHTSQARSAQYSKLFFVLLSKSFCPPSKSMTAALSRLSPSFQDFRQGSSTPLRRGNSSNESHPWGGPKSSRAPLSTPQSLETPLLPSLAISSWSYLGPS